MTSEPHIKITCLLGTSRPGSYTGKALAIVETPGYAMYRETVPIPRGRSIPTSFAR